MIGMEDVDPYGSSLTPGTFLQTTSPQVSFFNRLPGEGDQPNKLLANNTDVKVISTSGTYAKVEIVDTGEVGYVPSTLLGTKRAPEVSPTPPTPTIVPEAPETDPLVPEVAPEPESKCVRGFRLEHERRIVQVELLECVS